MPGLEVPADELRSFLASVPFAQPAERRHDAPRVAVPARLRVAGRRTDCPRRKDSAGCSANIAREHPELADRIVTTSPDVTVSTNLGALGEPPRRSSIAHERRADTIADERDRVAAELVDVAAGPAHRARHRREQPVHPARGARAGRPAVRHAAAADRHGLRSVHQPRSRRAELRVLPGRAVHPRGHAVGPDARARGRRASVDATRRSSASVSRD